MRGWKKILVQLYLRDCAEQEPLPLLLEGKRRHGEVSPNSGLWLWTRGSSWKHWTPPACVGLAWGLSSLGG